MAPTRTRSPLALAVLSAAILLDALDLSITQVALPSIQRDLGLSPGALQWVATAYVLTYGGFLLLGGRAADLYGRRAVFLAGLVLFGVMSLASGLAPGVGTLVATRALQGLVAALTVPAAVSIITTAFSEGPERNRALGVFAASASAGFSVGLVLGGVLTDLLGWRWIFLVKVPIVAAVVVAAIATLPRRGRPGGGRGLDIAGAVLGTAGLLLLVLVVTQVAEPAVGRPLLVGLALAATAALGGFVVVERRAADPLLPFRIFGNRTVRHADLASLTVLVAAGFALLLRIDSGAGYAGVLLPAVVVCFGLSMGVAYPVFTIAAVSGVDDADQGLAAGVQSTALQVGGGLGLALVSGAVAAMSDGGSDPVAALRVGAALGTALPLLGAVVAATGLPRARSVGPQLVGHHSRSAATSRAAVRNASTASDDSARRTTDHGNRTTGEVRARNTTPSGAVTHAVVGTTHRRSAASSAAGPRRPSPGCSTRCPPAGPAPVRRAALSRRSRRRGGAGGGPCGSSRSPERVRATRRVSRSNRDVPSSASSCRIDADRAAGRGRPAPRRG